MNWPNHVLCYRLSAMSLSSSISSGKTLDAISTDLCVLMYCSRWQITLEFLSISVFCEKHNICYYWTSIEHLHTDKIYVGFYLAKFSDNLVISFSVYIQASVLDGCLFYCLLCLLLDKLWIIYRTCRTYACIWKKGFSKSLLLVFLHCIGQGFVNGFGLNLRFWSIWYRLYLLSLLIEYRN